jgi:hypothetical protein
MKLVVKLIFVLVMVFFSVEIISAVVSDPPGANFAIIEDGTITSFKERNQAFDPTFEIGNDLELISDFFIFLSEINSPSGIVLSIGKKNEFVIVNGDKDDFGIYELTTISGCQVKLTTYSYLSPPNPPEFTFTATVGEVIKPTLSDTYYYVLGCTPSFTVTLVEVEEKLLLSASNTQDMLDTAILIPGTDIKIGMMDLTPTTTPLIGECLDTINMCGGPCPPCSTTTTIPSTGSIVVSSSPNGATVYLDSIAKGTTNILIEEVSVGSHVIWCKKEGYEDSVAETVSVTPGETSTVTCSLSPLSGTTTTTLDTTSTGSISVTSVPDGASVFLDAVEKGTATVLIEDVSEGSHIVWCKKEGYQDYTQDVDINAGDISTELQSQPQLQSQPH